MSLWTSIFICWLAAFPSTVFMSGWMTARSSEQLLTEPDAYYRSQDPVALAALLAFFFAALLSLLCLVVFIRRIVRKPEATRSSEIIKLAAVHGLIVLLTTSLVVAGTFWDGQPTHGKVEGFSSAAISPSTHARP